MDNLQITCNYCDMPAKLKRDKIYMQCHCCDDRRIIDIREYLLEDKTDTVETKVFNPKNVFEASDYIIDRLALLFERERLVKK